MPESNSERDRIIEAYLQMAQEAHYRPAAPSDGLGNIQLSAEELRNGKRLSEEAAMYADEFIRDANGSEFNIGIPNWRTNRALVYTVEAARSLCGAQDELALNLLKMAVAEVESVRR
jgi:hypothetical protein